MKALFALNPYIWKYKRYLLLGVVFVIAANLFSVYPAQVVRSAIDMVSDEIVIFELLDGFQLAESLKEDLWKSLLLFGGLVIGMALLRGLFLFLTRQTLIVMSRLVEFDLRKDLYDHLQNLSTSFYRRNRTGDLMARMSEDVSRVRMYLGPGIMYTLNTISLALVVIITMLAVNPELTFYALLPLPALSYLVYYVESIIQAKSDKIQKQLSVLTTFTQEVFSGIRVLKAYVKEKETENRFGEEAELYKEKSMSLARVDAAFMPAIIFLVGLSTILTIWIGGERVISGRFTIGNIAEFIIYINLLTWPIIAIGWVTTLIQRAAASQVRLNELLAERSEIKFTPRTTAGPKQASLKFKGVSFTYQDTGIKAIKDLSFELKPGQKLGILGATGSGKSTLCALIPRLFDIDEGQILLDDMPLSSYSKAALRQAIGYAPQDVFLFSDTIRNNIAFGKPVVDFEAIQAAATKAAVATNIEGFPKSYDTLVGERGVTLSGGQKQRISLARAWLKEPQLLILDDVLSAVDTNTEETILQHLRTYRTQNPEVAVIMVAHRISCIQDSDHIIVLENGKLIEEGTHESLVRQQGYYQRIFEKQLSEEAEPSS
ncbi:MAG: ABC transporter ATP-binding protein [Bacteroidota bacterium]